MSKIPLDDVPQRPTETLFRCPHTGKEFYTMDNFVEHMLQEPRWVVTVPVAGVKKGHLPDFAFLSDRMPEDTPYGKYSDIPTVRERKQYSHFVGAYRVNHDRYRCQHCGLVFFTWEQLKAHMRHEKHCLMRCEDCGELLDWDEESPNSPVNHARSRAELHDDGSGAPRKLHAGIIGVYRTKVNFVVRATPNFEPAPLPLQYKLSVPKGSSSTALGVRRAFGSSSSGASPSKASSSGEFVVYRTKLSYAFALQQHSSRSASEVPLLATCIQSRDCVNQPLLEACRYELKTGHTHFKVGVYPDPLDIAFDVPETPPPLYAFMYQCPSCFSLRRDWKSLATHMHFHWHGSVVCSVCEERIPAAEARRHFSEGPCKERGYHCGGELLSPQRCCVALDLTQVDILELVDEPEDAIDPCFAQDENYRFVFQCPLETCLRVYPNEEQLRSHLYQSKHGVYNCPITQQSLCVWTKEFADHSEPKQLPKNSHLANKESTKDFLAIYKDSDLVELFSNTFEKCGKCEMVVDVTSKRVHEGTACTLRKRFPDANVREFLVDPTVEARRTIPATHPASGVKAGSVAPSGPLMGAKTTHTTTAAVYPSPAARVMRTELLLSAATSFIDRTGQPPEMDS